jgi:hypothetical protein
MAGSTLVSFLVSVHHRAGRSRGRRRAFVGPQTEPHDQPGHHPRELKSGRSAVRSCPWPQAPVSGDIKPNPVKSSGRAAQRAECLLPWSWRRRAR